MDRGAWQATLHGVSKSKACLTDSAQPCSSIPTLVGFRDGSAGKTSACNAGDTGDNVQSLGQEDPLK